MSALINQLITMLEMQDAMNSRVNENWREKNFEWYRAIWVESAELLDHYGWKWWKKQDPEMQQVYLELVDIWHFGLSIMLMEKKSNDDIALSIQQNLKMVSVHDDFKQAVEAFVASTLSTKQFDLEGFGALLSLVDLSFNDLYIKYVGKNVLNFFRQDKGYKQGTYIKVWEDGREDNEHLAELAEKLNPSDKEYRYHIYDGLCERYPD